MDRAAKLRLMILPPLVMAVVTLGAWLAVERTTAAFVVDQATGAVRTHAEVAAELVRDLAPDAPAADFDALADRLGAASRLRVTYVDVDGRVLGDSRLSASEIAHVDNHADRPEIRAALEHGFGTSTRFSTTLGADLIYVAIPYRLGDRRGTARVAQPRLEIDRGLEEGRSLMLGVALATILAATWLIYLVNRNLLDTIERERRGVEDHVAARTARIAKLQEMGSLLTACETVDEAGRIIRATVESLLPVSGGALALFKSSRNHLNQVLSWGRQVDAETIFAPADCWALRRGMEHYTTRDNESTRCAHVGEVGDSTALCLPLQAQGETLGLLQLVAPRREQLSGEPLQLLKTLTEHAAVALGNIQLHEILREQAVRDPLTGLFNRRYLADSLAREIARAARHEQPLALLMIDIDHFKSFNDRFGHEAGDLVLASVGRVIADSTRSEDIACRYGGEEFVLALVGSDEARAREVGERLCEAVHQLPLSFRGQALSAISISIGVAIMRGPDDSAQAMLQTADEMLYRAKHTGRNRVVVAGTADDEDATRGA